METDTGRCRDIDEGGGGSQAEGDGGGGAGGSAGEETRRGNRRCPGRPEHRHRPQATGMGCRSPCALSASSPQPTQPRRLCSSRRTDRPSGWARANVSRRRIASAARRSGPADARGARVRWDRRGARGRGWRAAGALAGTRPGAGTQPALAGRSRFPDPGGGLGKAIPRLAIARIESDGLLEERHRLSRHGSAADTLARVGSAHRHTADRVPPPAVGPRPPPRSPLDRAPGAACRSTS